jgi:hypothetical protein
MHHIIGACFRFIKKVALLAVQLLFPNLVCFPLRFRLLWGLHMLKRVVFQLS